MNYNESHTDLFNAYLKRTLSDADLMAFEKRLKDDQEFADAFNFHQLMVEGVKVHARAELKQFLSQNATPAKGKTIRFSNMQWAAAAVIVVIIGIYAVTQFYIQPKKEIDLAIKPQEYKIPELNIDTNKVEVPYEQRMADSIQATESNKMESTIVSAEPILMDDAGSPPPISQIIDKALPMSEDSKESDHNYDVLSERKIKDSSITLFNIPLLASNYDNKNYKSQKAQASKLPQNANNAPATPTDKEEVTKGKKKSAPSGIKLQVEFWQSPVNFKGYKYWGNTIQLYGVDQNTASLYAINNNIYLRDKGIVYLLEINTDATPYNVESDEDIVQLILSQK